MKIKFIKKIAAILISAMLILVQLPIAVFAETTEAVHESVLETVIEDENLDEIDPLPETASEEEALNTEAMVELEPETSPEKEELNEVTETAVTTAEDIAELSIDINSAITLYVDTDDGDDSAERAEGAIYQTLTGAVSAAQSGDIIHIIGNVEIASIVSIDSGKALTITASETGRLARSSNYRGSFIAIYEGASLTLSNVTLDGGAVWENEENIGLDSESHLIACSGGDLLLEQGTVLCNNDSPSHAGSLLAVRSNGSLVIDGASLYGGRASNAGAMFVNEGATAILKSGSIYNNQARYDMGGALAFDNAAVTMEDGFKIYNNKVLGMGETGNALGGAIYIHKSTFKMTGGEIYENTAGASKPGYGGAIAMNGGDITMSGGSIYNNTAANWGGGIYYGGSGYTYGNSNFTMTGGIIKDNYAGNSGGGIYCYNQNSAQFYVFTNILGGTITGNRLAANGSNMAAPSEAIYANTVLRLSTDAVIDGAICLTRGGIFTPAGGSRISLISASLTTPNRYYITTDSYFDITDGRVVVEPGSFSYEGRSYEINDAKPYQNLFYHNVKAIIPGGHGTANPSATESLILSGQMISFDLNKPADAAGSLVPSSIAPINGRSGDIIMLLPDFPPNPALENYKFLGWSLDINGTNPLTAAMIMGNSALTLYAQWELLPYNPGGGGGGSTLPVTYTVTYTDGVDGEIIFEDQVYVVESGLATPAFKGTPSRVGYEFAGWNPAVASTVTANAVYQATWVKAANQFTVIYTDGVEDEFVFADQEFVVDSGAATPAFKGTPARAGYKFVGWDPKVSPTVTADVIYRAMWKAKDNKDNQNLVPSGENNIPGDNKPNSNGPENTVNPDPGRKPIMSPNTGDGSSLYLVWSGLIVIVSTGAWLLLVKKYKRIG